MLSDLRLSLRALAKSPTFTVVAVFTIVLGIGVNAAMFSIVNAIMFRGLPFPQPDRLVHLEQRNPVEQIDGIEIAYQDFVDYRAGQTTLQGLAAYYDGTLTLSGPGQDPVRVEGTYISAGGPEMLGVPPSLGRWFRAEEDNPGAPPVIVLGHSYWRNHYKSDPAVVGRPLRINGEWGTIIGVGPVDYRFPEVADAWVPLRYKKTDEKRDVRFLEVLGRLKEGATLGLAQAEFATLNQRLVAAHPVTNKNLAAVVKPLQVEFVGDDTRRLLFIMLGAVFFVLLIACANVANLLLARAATREKEMAIRTAVGAGRGRIIRLLLAESLVLSAVGAGGGLALAFGLMKLFRDYINANNPAPYWMVWSVDTTGVLYVGALAIVTCVAAGLFPALRVSQPDLNTVLKDAGRGSTGFSLSRFTRALVVAEVALSCVLLVLAGLTIHSIIKMQTASLGFDPQGVMTARVALPDTEYKDEAKQRAFFQELRERLAARPEFTAVGAADAPPTWNNRSPILIDGRAPDPSGKGGPYASVTTITPGYFPAMSLRLLQGRDFSAADAETAQPVAIVSAAFAQQYWPQENPVGKRFRRGTPEDKDPGPWLTVVGVVPDTLKGQFDAKTWPQAYACYLQAKGATQRMTLFAKVRAGDPAATAPLLRATVRELNDDLPIYFTQTLTQLLDEAKFFKKLFGWIFGIFGGVALVLAGVGLYGVMAYSVAQRTQEIGVRMALGAGPGAVLRLILREGGMRLALGLGLGSGIGYLGGMLLASELYGVTAGDPATFAGTLLTLGAIGMLATLVPALRALRVNPVEALRN
ncbi:MAG TPA: ABC transporter permease [Lacunisphaera sp.]|jgi:putative ABC transport system permease protein|nr:ABC transporter permease [Lacunisphaera sp.]HQY04533.1 ABC transporter permease [Lacunisphaera sp.]